MSCTLSHPLRQRGAATIVVMLGLLGALALGVLFAHRGELLEARMSANQARSTAAFEAADAGLDWALAQLNALQPSGQTCRADTTAATSFRERMIVSTSGGLTARAAADGTPMRAACVRRGGQWICHCPVDGATVPPASNDADPAAFIVEIQPGDRPGVVNVVSTGSVSSRTTARAQASLALLPALSMAPAAALTARGAISAGSTSVSIVNEDAPSAGLVLHAGGAVTVPAGRLTTTAGSSTSGAIASDDNALAATAAARLFVAHAGLAPQAWRDQPTVRRVECSADCAGGLEATASAQAEPSMLWVDGDATLSGPATLGRPERPLMLVVRGRLTVQGAVTVHGLIVADGITWQGAGGATLDGAAISSADIALDAPVSVRRDAGVLSTLMQRTGSFVRVPGSWRDF